MRPLIDDLADHVRPGSARAAYVDEQLSVMQGVPVHVRGELVDLFWGALTCDAEEAVARDVHGNVVAEETERFQAGVLGEPTLNERLAELGEPGEPRWPDGRRFAAVLTHDVDRIVEHPWRERTRQAAAVRAGTIPGSRVRLLAQASALRVQSTVGRSDHAPFDRYVREEERLGFRSSFLVLPDRLLSASRYDHWYAYDDVVRHEGSRATFREAARSLAARGWDVGLHGSYASAHDLDVLVHDRSRVESVIEAPVVSTRQHFLRFDARTTPRIQAAAGLQVDSSLGYSSAIGCRNGLALPFFWAHDDLLEVPLLVQDVALFRGADGAMPVDDAVARAGAVIERVATLGGAVTLSWHAHPGETAHAAYRALLDLVERNGGWGCSLADMNNWWRERRARLRARSGEKVATG